jgi:hypothetical protein
MELSTRSEEEGAGIQPNQPPLKRVDEINPPVSTKPLSFFLAFLPLNISTLVVSLDATALAVAIPVSSER